MSIQPKVIALGFFDGVHLGHGALLRRTVEEARRRGVRSAVFTWAQPPKEVVTGVPVPLINSRRTGPGWPKVSTASTMSSWSPLTRR